VAERTLKALIQSRFDPKGAQDAAKGLGGVSQEAGKQESALGSLNSSWVKLGASIAGVGVVTKKIFDFGEQGAGIERLRDAGEDLAAGFGVSFDEIQDKVREASLNTVSDLDVMRAANRAMMLGVSADADQLASLMEVAAFRGRAMGLTTTQAFSDIVTGVGRMSPLILDNLGIVVDAESRYAEYAETMGITADELDTATKRQILLNSVLEEGQSQIAAAGGLVEDTATKFERMDAAVANAGDALKESLSPYIAEAANGLYLLLTYGEQVEGMLQEHEDAALSTGKAYSIYAKEQVEAGLAAGLLAETQAAVILNSIENADLVAINTQRFGDLSDATLAQARANGELGLSEVNRLMDLRREADAAEDLMARFGMLNETQYDAIRATNEHSDGLMDGRDALKAYTAEMAKADQAAGRGANATKLFSLEIWKLINAADDSQDPLMAWATGIEEAASIAAEAARRRMQEMGTYISGPLGREIEDFTEQQDELKTKAADVMTEIERLKQSGYSEQSTRLQELRGEYEDLQGQITANADAHEEATKRIVFDLLTMRLAASELTMDQQADALMTIAEQMGLIDAPTKAFYDALKEIDPLLASENPEGYAAAIEHLRKAAEDGVVTALELKQALTALDGLTVDMYINMHQNNTGTSTGWSGGGYQDPDNPNNGPNAGGATGLEMDVPPGFPGDSFMVAATTGEHVSITKPGQSAGGGTTYSVNVNQVFNGPADPAAVRSASEGGVRAALRAQGRA